MAARSNPRVSRPAKVAEIGGLPDARPPAADYGIRQNPHSAGRPGLVAGALPDLVESHLNGLCPCCWQCIGLAAGIRHRPPGRIENSGPGRSDRNRLVRLPMVRSVWVTCPAGQVQAPAVRSIWKSSLGKWSFLGRPGTLAISVRPASAKACRVLRHLHRPHPQWSPPPLCPNHSAPPIPRGVVTGIAGHDIYRGQVGNRYPPPRQPYVGRVSVLRFCIAHGASPGQCAEGTRPGLRHPSGPSIA